MTRSINSIEFSLLVVINFEKIVKRRYLTRKKVVQSCRSEIGTYLVKMKYICHFLRYLKTIGCQCYFESDCDQPPPCLLVAHLSDGNPISALDLLLSRVCERLKFWHLCRLLSQLNSTEEAALCCLCFWNLSSSFLGVFL